MSGPDAGSTWSTRATPRPASTTVGDRRPSPSGADAVAARPGRPRRTAGRRSPTARRRSPGESGGAVLWRRRSARPADRAAPRVRVVAAGPRVRGHAAARGRRDGSAASPGAGAVRSDAAGAERAQAGVGRARPASRSPRDADWPVEGRDVGTCPIPHVTAAPDVGVVAAGRAPGRLLHRRTTPGPPRSVAGPSSGFTRSATDDQVERREPAAAPPSRVRAGRLDPRHGSTLSRAVAVTSRLTERCCDATPAARATPWRRSRIHRQVRGPRGRISLVSRARATPARSPSMLVRATAAPGRALRVPGGRVAVARRRCVRTGRPAAQSLRSRT